MLTYVPDHGGLTSDVYAQQTGPHENWNIELVRKIMATVPMPADVVFPGAGAGVVLLTTVTMTKHNDMRRAEIPRVGFLPHHSEKTNTYVATLISFSAPNSPVISKSLSPGPTRSLKN
jgi:hypothetical protein